MGSDAILTAAASLDPGASETGAIMPLSAPPVSLPRRARLLLALATAFAWAPSSVSAQEPGRFFEMRPVVPGVWAAVVRGGPRPFAVTNSLVVVSDDGVLVVDTQQSAEAVQDLIGRIREVTDRPVRWVVNTHWHLDHVGGNQALIDAFGPGVAVLAHARTREDMIEQGPARLEREVTTATEALATQQLSFERIKDSPLLNDSLRAEIAQLLEMRDRYLQGLSGLRLHPPGVSFQGDTTLLRAARAAGLTLEESWDRVEAAAAAVLRGADGRMPVRSAIFFNWLEAALPRAWYEAPEG